METFKTEIDFKSHMTDEPEHDYCEKCDVVCEDYEDYLSHKVKSDKHIACPQCGLDFNGVRTLESHIKRVRSSPTAH